jgi:hypothetical protein
MPKASNTNSEYVIFFAFPLLKSLRERTSLLCYTFVAASIALACERTPSHDASVPPLILAVCKTVRCHSKIAVQRLVCLC